MSREKRLAARAVTSLVAVALAGALHAGRAHADGFVWPNVPERVGRALASADVAERRTAANQMRDLPRELSRPLVLRALTDADIEVRVTAASVAARHRTEGASDAVIPWLSETEPRLRLAACTVILAMPSAKGVSALARVLGDQSPPVRLAAARAMGASRLADTVSPLLGHLDDSSPEVRAEIARALGMVGDARAVLPLVGKVQDSSPEVRRRAARSLGEIGDARAVPALVVALSDQSLDVRLEAVSALGKLKSDEATAAIASVVEGQVGGGTSSSAPPSTDALQAMRQAALAALGTIGSDRAITTLTAALAQDRPEAGRTPARDALLIAGAAAVPQLVAYLAGNPPPDAATACVMTLGELRDDKAVDPIVRGMQRGVVPLAAGLDALASLGSDRALPSVLELLQSTDPKVRRSAIAAAQRLLDPSHPDGRAVEPVKLALDNPRLDATERVGLVRLLGRTGAPSGEPVLRGFARAKNVSLRRAALTALGSLQLGSTAVDEVLLEALSDENAAVRMDAAIALSRVGTGATAPKLLDLLLTGAEQDRGAVGVALAGAASRSRDAKLAERAAGALDGVPVEARDALIEVIGRAPASQKTAELLEDLARRGTDDRRKTAEIAVQSPPLLALLAKDKDAGVRANAAWSLGEVADEAARPLLATLTRDADAAVSANAIAALGRAVVGGRLAKATSTQPLCAALSDPRPYVRANGLVAVTLAGVPCDLKVVIAMIENDTSEVVRVRAARYLARHAADPTAQKALSRCRADDPNADVASACGTAPAASPAARGPARPLTVFVVPDGREAPVAAAPFALVLPEGWLRLGATDRRGAVFERNVSFGVVSLAMPAPFVR